MFGLCVWEEEESNIILVDRPSLSAEDVVMEYEFSLQVGEELRF